ncbi:hypothetical protein Atc_2065 [Acidithiobacillus caldus SM-1]|uniref:Uncharacterized protein n=2 Tax=Acidithiobacillus caldus TaxID=33059 RepID=F9ZQI8_ACICS|nr:hypothetical protein Atc_2065 [Acidithiobacillus caldus SM-1]
MEKNVLGAMILEQEKMLENAQHRIVVELCRSRLDLMRHIDQRLTVDRAMICAIPSVAVVQALRALRQIEWVGGRMLWSGRALNRS